MNKRYINITVMLLTVSSIVWQACKDDEVYPRTRLFMPVLTENLSKSGNAIIVDIGKMKGAIKYTFDISRDTFKTIEETVETEMTHVVFDDLIWNYLYQVRVVAHAEDPAFDSKSSFLGVVSTDKYPSIMKATSTADVTDVAARLFWNAEGAPLTHIRVFSGNDLKLTTPILQYELTPTDLNAKTRSIYGLSPATKYIIGVYSGEELRGYDNFNTLKQGPTGPLVIDLRQVTFKPGLVTDTIPDIPSGSTILLKKGKTYTMTGPALEIDKSLIFTSGLDFGDNARLHFTGNFNFPTTTPTIDSLVFRDVTITGASIASNYVGNFSRAGTIKAIKFDRVKGSVFRGLTRTQGAVAITIEKYIVKNCVLDSLGGYGVLTVDNVANKVDDVQIENSTISKGTIFLHIKNNVSSLSLTGCTISETPNTGGIMFRFSGGAAKNNVSNGITIKDCVFGHGWDPTVTGVKKVKGIEGLPSTNFTIINTYGTSDFEFVSDPIPGFPLNSYNNTTANLWKDPYKEDFNFKDAGFTGKFDSGDPRWRSQH